MTHNPPRPTSSPTSSRPGDDLTHATSSLVPHPVGGRGRTETSTPPTTTTPPPRPRDEVDSRPRCAHCDDVVEKVNFALGTEWMHVNPRASFPTQHKGTMWRHCRLSVATPKDGPL